jgi:hypothetical protein
MFPFIPGTPGARCHTPTNSCARGSGSGLSNTLSITLKMAVFAPIPSATVSTAMAVNPGVRRNRRRTCSSDFIGH